MRLHANVAQVAPPFAMPIAYIIRCMQTLCEHITQNMAMLQAAVVCFVHTWSNNSGCGSVAIDCA